VARGATTTSVIERVQVKYSESADLHNEYCEVVMIRQQVSMSILVAAFWAGCAITADPEPDVDVVTSSTTVGPCADACRGDFSLCNIDCPNCTICRRQLNNCLARCDSVDSDGDGRLDGSDNCPGSYNPDQANCDGDSLGNACDPLNASYIVTVPERTCMIDKDEHVAYKTFEHWVERMEHDVSACGAPDRWIRRIRQDEDCSFNVSDEQCCRGLTASLSATGAPADPWCTTWRNHDFCI
jgi:hypothetical protein